MNRRAWMAAGALALACAPAQPPAHAPSSGPEPPPSAPASPPEAPTQPATPPKSGRRAQTDVPLPECNGAMTPELLEAIQRQAAATKRCYEQALNKDSSVTGRVVVTLVFLEDGELTRYFVAEESVGHPELVECIQARLAEGVYPPPKNGCVNVQLPLNFVPKKDEPEASENDPAPAP